MKYSVCGTVRQYRSKKKLGIEPRVIWFDYFFNQRLLNKKTDSGDHKPAPMNNIKPRGNINNLAFQSGQCETARRVSSRWTTIAKPQTHLFLSGFGERTTQAYPHPRRRDGRVHDGHDHRATPPDLEKHLVFMCASLSLSRHWREQDISIGETLCHLSG